MYAEPEAADVERLVALTDELSFGKSNAAMPWLLHISTRLERSGSCLRRPFWPSINFSIYLQKMEPEALFD